MKATLYAAAIQEVIEAMSFYDSKKRGLGNEFYEEILATVRRIEKYPKRWSRIHGEIRRCRAKRFPYKVIYRLRGSDVEIIAVMHDSRDSSNWTGRI